MPPLQRLLITVMAVLTFAFAASAQYRFDAWTTDNGLPQNGVRQIVQTPDGYLWFTTFDGLVRFDGVKFTTFNKSNTPGIINNRFTRVFAEKDGTVYASTTEDGVLTVYRDGKFSSMTADAVPGNFIMRIEADDDGRAKFLVENEDRLGKSWYRLHDRQFEFIGNETDQLEPQTLVGKNGSDWTVEARGITERRGGESRFFPLDLSGVNYRPTLFEESDGSLWIAENSVHHLANGGVETIDSAAAAIPPTSIFHSFWEPRPGEIWFASGGAASPGAGLVRVIGDQVSTFGKDYGLISPSIHDVLHDREGTTWLATNQGLARMRRQAITTYSVKDGLDEKEIYPILRDSKDTIWIGSTHGLNTYRDGKFQSVKIEAGKQDLPENEKWRNGLVQVQSLWEDPTGKMWVGAYDGLYLVENGVAETVTRGYHVFAIKGDKNGNVWAATNKGLLRFNDYNLSALYTVKDGLPNESMTTVFEDSKGHMWFGGYGGLSRLDDGKFTNYTAAEGLAGNYVRSIHEDADGSFWIGTYDQGLSRFKDQKFTNYTEADGLFNNGVFAIEEDGEGNFWISSNRGIYRVSQQELSDFAAGKIGRINSVGYGKQDGMLSNECNGGRQPASIRDRDGRLWFPTQDGVSVVDPRLDEPNLIPPIVVIEDVLSERRSIGLSGGSISVEPNQRDLEIRFTAASSIKPEQIRFQYRLEGHDEDWIDSGTRREAIYSYLPPGEYTFHVRAVNSDGVWSTQGGDLNVQLRPYFYQTTTFVLLVIVVGALGLLLVWKFSVHQLEAREAKLTRLVAARTADLASAMENMQALANSDGLTKIGNRRRFESFLADEWHRAVRFKTQISLVMVDIDHFKLYNDTYGHQAGDECLQRVAEAFASTVKRPTDLVARFGGEEFAMVLGGTDAAGALQIVERAVANIRDLGILHSESLTNEFLTVSVGVASVLANFDMSESDLIKLADSALYRAKRDGRDRVVTHDYFRHGPVNMDIAARSILFAG